MKKKIVVATILMSFTIVACGSAETTIADALIAQTQEQEQEVKREQESNSVKEEQDYTEYEYFFTTDILDLNNPDETPINNNEFSPNGEYCGEYKLCDSVKLYASKEDKAYEIGYTKPNIPITCFNSSDDWIDLYFENEISPNDYRLIKVEDFLANYEPADPIGGVIPKRVGDSAKLQKFVDDDNYYTPGEYWTLVKASIEKMVEEDKENFEKYKVEYPEYYEQYGYDLQTCTEADSKEGLEKISQIAPSLLKEECNENRIDSTALSIFMQYEVYYIEFVGASDEYCDFYIYAKEREEK